MSPAVAMVKKKKEEEEDVKGGELLFCGTTTRPVARTNNKASPSTCFVSPTRFRSLVGVDIRYVASGCASSHCVALSVDGRCFTWGKNENGQLGHGDKIPRDSPTVVSGLSKYKVIKAASGGGHTVVQTEDGFSFSFGWNKHGQLGTGSNKKEFELSPVQCLITDVRDVACGTDFTVWLTSLEGASILTAGLPQYGQLGHGTDHEYNTRDSCVRLAYEAQPRPKAIASLSDETILKVACGSNHTVALGSKGYIYTWGFGGYGRLGHKEQKDEWIPRHVEVFTKHNLVPPDAIISAGSASSACTAGVGKIYVWGKIKSTGDNYMYPKPLMDLSGWKIRCMDSGSFHYFVGAESSCISWGVADGQLGYGPNEQKSSATPKKVDILEGMEVISVACGLAHSLVVVDRSNVGNQLDQGVHGPMGVHSVPPNPLSGVGKIYVWGKIKSTGDNYMYPKPLMDLSGWKIRCMDSGSFHYFVGAESSCISWGVADGQLGYGPNEQKSSATPKKVDILEGMEVISVACGLAHSLVVVDRSNVGNQLDQLDIYDDKDTDEGKETGSERATSKKTKRNSAAKTPVDANKRKKKTKESSESEVIEESHETENDSDEGIKEPATSKKTTRNSAAKPSDNANKRKKQTEKSSESEVLEESNESDKDSGPATSKKTTRNSAAKPSDSANKRKKKTEKSSTSEVLEESHESDKDSDEKTSGRKKQRSGKTSSRSSSAAAEVATPLRRGRSRTKTS